MEPLTGWPGIAIGVVGGLLVLWTALVASLWFVGRAPSRAGLGEALRLLPDVVRLIRRLAADPTLPVGLRLRLAALLGYLLLPFDLVPDFVPVVGYADDLILVAVILRSVVRRAGAQAIDRHWPGTQDGLRAVKALVGVPS